MNYEKLLPHSEDLINKTAFTIKCIITFLHPSNLITMKTHGLTLSKTNIIFSLLALMMMFSFTAPDVENNFAVSSVSPSARGSVKIKKDEQNNYVIRIYISDLLDVTSLSPPKNTYVVWMVTDGYVTKNLGQLNRIKNSFSSELKASFETISPIKPSKIFITAENDATLLHPGVQVILATNRF